MEQLNLHEKLNFDNFDLRNPSAVIADILTQIQKETDGVITGIVAEYDGDVESYTEVYKNFPVAQSLVTAFTRATQPSEQVVKVDIQNNLGKQGDAIEKYEVYLCTSVFKQYKYRICFLQHGIANYPVKVVVEQSIADEINKRGLNSSCTYMCENPSSLEELMLDILNTKTMLIAMQEIIHIHHIHQDDNQET